MKGGANCPFFRGRGLGSLVNLGAGIELLTANGGAGLLRENRVVWLYGACSCPPAGVKRPFLETVQGCRGPGLYPAPPCFSHTGGCVGLPDQLPARASEEWGAVRALMHGSGVLAAVLAL